jgi:uncharacterized membrane protein
MTKPERLFIAGLGMLITLAVAVILLAPRETVGSEPAQQNIDTGSETMSARVIEVLEEGTVDLGEGSTQPYQELLLRVEEGSLAGKEVLVSEGTVNIISQDRLFRPGDRVYLERVSGPTGDRLYISDFVRGTPLVWITVVFITLVVIVGRRKGVQSLLGTLFSLAVIFGFVLPQILAGQDPVRVSVAGSIVLLAVSTYMVYGINAKAHAAVVGMMFSLSVTGLLSWLFVNWTRLSGLAAEESAFLVMQMGSTVDLRGLVLGGIIIGSLGVLDDVCVGQASAVFELANANPDLRWRQLFQRSLNIGRDHIAAMVNTLMLAYVGASMPLMLVFIIYQEPLWRRVNREPIAEEIVRTMVGSVGLILAVPITSLAASLLARWVIKRPQIKAA